MKLHSLKLNAIGSYATEQFIDFLSFGSNPIFLIDGPTGAGKSTLLNAICFALYGESGIDNSQNDRLLCDHVAPDGSAYVELVLELRGEILRITRTPKYQPVNNKTPKGEAVTLEVQQDSGDWHITEGLKKEIDALIESKLSLSAKQFSQVIVLPQGRFRDILMASSKDREGIYSTLFGTERFEAITKALVQEYDKLKKDNAAAIEKRKALFSSASESGEVTNETELATLIDTAKQTQSQANTVFQDSLTKQTAAQNAVNDATNLQASFTARETAKQALAELATQSEDMGKKQGLIGQLEVAEKIQPLYQQHQTARQLAQNAHEQVASTQKSLETQQTAVAGCQNTFDLANQQYLQLPKLREHAGQLQSALDKLNALATSQSTLATIMTNNEKLKASIAPAELALAQKQTDIEGLKQQIADNHAIAKHETTHMQTQHQQQAIERLLIARDQAISTIEEKQNSITDGNAFIEEQESTYKHAVQARETLQMHFYQNLALDLAKKLQPDAPCLVCGSLEHPHPATPNDDTVAVSEEDIEAAYTAEQGALTKLEKSRTRLQERKQELSAAKEAHAQLISQLGENAQMTQQAIMDALDATQALINEAQQASKDVATLTASLTQAQDEWSAMNEQLVATREQTVGLDAQIEQLETQIKEQTSQLGDGFTDQTTVSQSLTNIQQQITRYDQEFTEAQKALNEAKNLESTALANVQNAIEQAKQADIQAAAAAKQWDDKLLQSVLPDEAAYLNAIAQLPQLSVIQAEHKHYVEAVNKNTILLEQLNHQLKDKTIPDIDALQFALTACESAYNEALSVRDEANSALQRLTQIRTDLDKLDKENAESNQKLTDLEPLATAARGAGANKVSLQRYVLGVMLDEVLEVASVQLNQMSRGQFTLERLMDVGGNGGRGLELGVMDTYTGKLREVGSLSGGESFLASMALALALSQVVQEHAGGIQLETLFVDEGFGSLDNDTLQLVIDVLNDLQATGRAVGLISHVETMKDQFPNKIIVHKGNKGSRLEVESAA